MNAVVYWNAQLECMPREQLEQHQLRKLRELLAYLRERSPFYRRKLDAAGITPEEVRRLEDVRRIPTT